MNTKVQVRASNWLIPVQPKGGLLVKGARILTDIEFFIALCNLVRQVIPRWILAETL